MLPRIKLQIMMMMMPIVNVVIVPVWASPLTTYQVAAKGIFQVNALHTNVHCAPLLHSTLLGVMLNTELLFFYHIPPSCSHYKMLWTRFWFDVLISHWLRSDHLKSECQILNRVYFLSQRSDGAKGPYQTIWFHTDNEVTKWKLSQLSLPLRVSSCE